MAGGIYATAIPCLRCAGRADRIAEGLEIDYYRCQTCGYEFGIDWASAGAPLKPCWPISEAEADERRSWAAHVFGTGGTPSADQASHRTGVN